MFTRSELLAALKRYWGHSEFRPRQEEIVRNLLEGRDTCVVMPTGGGKSLCYQLPASLLDGKTVVVVSPLIALMQDQVAELRQMGIPAAFLNSTLGAAKQAEIVKSAKQGEYRLLYVSPERLARSDTRGWLTQVPVAYFAIDEAHCISEWGHEFRPEYRLLSGLREAFPKTPIAAFTASATRHVRHDIIEQLRLRDPAKFIASFHRSNLRYVVEETTEERQVELLLAAVRHFEGQSVIVYAPTIRRVEETVAYLASQKVGCVAYHGKMTAKVRERNQELWMADERTVLVGTLAFGLGINKPAVRAVIHLALPKSIEQFYQEAGRAGRDRHASDCILLWQKRDAGLLGHFAGQIADEKERERAWQRYHEVRGFAESRTCRHIQICRHFGETKRWSSCGACDVCGYRPVWWRAAPAKVTAPRRKRKSAASASQPWRVDPAATEKPERIVERIRPTPPSVPGFAAGSRKPWWGSARREIAGIASGGGGELLERLKKWRRETANAESVPTFVVMHDTTLEALCEARPRTIAKLLDVAGIGEKKAERYGEALLQIVKEFGE